MSLDLLMVLLIAYLAGALTMAAIDLRGRR
jgi:hypothetical protein